MGEKHVDILRHAIGWSEKNPQGYRNRFVSGPGCDHYAICEELEAAGLMVRRRVSFLHEDDVGFFVTDAGRKVAVSGGEG